MYAVASSSDSLPPFDCDEMQYASAARTDLGIALDDLERVG